MALQAIDFKRVACDASEELGAVDCEDDCAGWVMTKANALLAQANAYRELSSSLAHKDA